MIVVTNYEFPIIITAGVTLGRNTHVETRRTSSLGWQWLAYEGLRGCHLVCATHLETDTLSNVGSAHL